MRKRYIYVVVIVILLIIFYVYSKNKSTNYSINYKLNKFNVEEKYNKDSNIYTFKLTKDKYIFYYAINHKYTSNRKLVTKIYKETLDNKDLCINIKVFGNKQTTICSNKKEYYLKDNYLNKNAKVINKVEDVSIYKEFNYYEWNKYGIKDLTTNKDYNVLEKESYDNNLSYYYKNYIIFANYDEKNEYSKFYIFNIEKNKINTLKLSTKISSDSYFEGVYDNQVYLFDRKKSVQYAINPGKNEIKVTSDSEGAIYYDGNVSSKSLKEFKYKDLIFTDNYVYNYYIKDSTLYFKYFDSEYEIKLFENVDEIITYKDNKVIFISEGTIYKYDIYKGYTKLATSLEWEFHFENQIFVYGY